MPALNVVEKRRGCVITTFFRVPNRDLEKRFRGL